MVPKKKAKTTSGGQPLAYSYVRFSTVEQMRGGSLQRQTEAAKAYAAAHGLKLDDQLTFRDLGTSAFRGRNVQRGALGAFLQAVDDGIIPRGSYLLVEALDRVSRDNPFDANLVLQNIIQRGIVVVTLLGGERVYSLETVRKDPMVMLESIFKFIGANDESAKKSSRNRADWQRRYERARKDGRVFMKTTPAWMEKKGDEIVLIPAKAKVVREIVDRTLKGQGREGIATELNRRGIGTLGQGRLWSGTAVRKLLNNRAMRGDLVPTMLTEVEVEDERGFLVRRKVAEPQEPIHGYYPAVIDGDTWDRLQTLLAAKGTRGASAGVPFRNLFSGLAECPSCGGRMSRKVPSKGEPPRFVCNGARYASGCPYRTARVDAVEAAFLSNIDDLVANVPNPDNEIERDLQLAQAGVEELEGRIGALLDQLEAKPSAAIAARVRKLETELDVQKAHRDELAARAAQSESRALKVRTAELLAATTAKTLDRRRVNAALKTLVEGVVIDYGTGELRFRWRHAPSQPSAIRYTTTSPFPAREGGFTKPRRHK